MAWAAIALPIAAQVLGSMGKKDEKGEGGGQASAPPPSLGEIFGANARGYNTGQQANPGFAPSQFSQLFTGGQK